MELVHHRRETTMKFRFPSPAVVIASLALLLSLTGTAVAGALITGAQIANNTVATLDLKNNDVRSIDVKNNNLTTLDVLNGTLRKVDFAPGQLQPGPAGPAGPAGPEGPAGPQGAPGLAGLEIVSSTSPASSNPGRMVQASCPAGKVVVGGGGRVAFGESDVALDESFPVDANTWRVLAYELNATAAVWTLTAHAVCASAAA